MNRYARQQRAINRSYYRGRIQAARERAASRQAGSGGRGH